jgi:hypothetical protein
MTPISTLLEQSLADTPIADLPAFLGVLATVTAKAQVKLLHREPAMRVPPDAGDYLKVEEVAARFHVSPTWLYRHKRQMPHSQPSRKILLFPEQAITKWFASRKGP